MYAIFKDLIAIYMLQYSSPRLRQNMAPIRVYTVAAYPFIRLRVGILAGEAERVVNMDSVSVVVGVDEIIVKRPHRRRPDNSAVFVHHYFLKFRICDFNSLSNYINWGLIKFYF